MNKRLNAVEKRFYRRILHISYTRHVTNEEVLNRMAATRTLINTVRNRQMSISAYVMRNKEIESISGKIKGKCCRGRQRITYTRSLNDWMNINEVDRIRAAGGRDKWRTITVNARTGHNT